MKSSRLLAIVLPALLVVLAFVGPFRWLQGSAQRTDAEAKTAEAKEQDLKAKLRTAQAAQQNEAALKAELAKIRTVLPELPEDVASPLIRTISDEAIAHGVQVQVQGNSQGPFIDAPGTAVAAGAAGASAPKADASGTDPTAPKAYAVNLEVSGSAAGVVDFIGALPTSGRVWVYKVEMKGGGEGGFNPDLNARDADSSVTATIELRSYASPNASATAPLPGS